jgi:O-antigen ligase
MLNKNIENPLAKILYIGVPFIAILVTATINSDPVNAPKALVLGTVSFGALAIALRFGIKIIWKDSPLALIFSVAFILFALISVIFSASPLEQLLYGVGGRNTGFVTYLSLTFILVGTLPLRNQSNFGKIILGLLFAGVVNFSYNLVVIFGKDPIPWTNPYMTILGTFGNPNFVSAFMSFFVAICTVFIFDKRKTWPVRIVLVVFVLVSLFEIKKSNSIQGIIASALGFAVIGFFVLRSHLKGAMISRAYLLIALFTGIAAIMGMLQKGPLAPYLYKRTVSLRGEYWNAGWNMGISRPFTGVGIDSYGIWYRELRRASALVNPGPETITNSAHNVFMDIFAGGGFPLFIAYSGLLALVLVSIIRVTRRTNTYDPIFISLTVGWLCYVAQSMVSINQIGLAVWGWLFGGALIAYEVGSRREEFFVSEPGIRGGNRNKSSKIQSNSATPASVTLVAFIGLVVGTIVACPPAIADAKWRSALSSGNAEKVMSALDSWPQDSGRLAQGANLLAQSNLNEPAYKYAKIGVKFNPRYTDAWKVLGGTPLATEEDKKLANENLRLLDSRNPANKLAP